jgi:hypothetical protein
MSWTEITEAEFLSIKSSRDLRLTRSYTNMSDSYAETVFGIDDKDMLKTIHYAGIHNMPNFYKKGDTKMKNADMPAMPYIEYQSGGDPVLTCEGLTKREQFCLNMGVAETGDSELDDVIRNGNKQKFAAMAMQGLCSKSKAPENLASMNQIIKAAAEVADALLKELQK